MSYHTRVVLWKWAVFVYLAAVITTIVLDLQTSAW